MITANATPLSGEVLPLKNSLEKILPSTDIQHVLVFKRTDTEVSMKPGRDEWLEEVDDLMQSRKFCHDSWQCIDYL